MQYFYISVNSDRDYPSLALLCAKQNFYQDLSWSKFIYFFRGTLNIFPNKTKNMMGEKREF